MLQSALRTAAAVGWLLAVPPALQASVVHFDGFEGPECSADDVDGDRLSECAERSQKTDPLLADTDDDGHEDGEEVLGTLGGLDLRALGADARRRDVFVEYDWFDDSLQTPGIGNCVGPGPHSHRPSLAALKIVTDAFAKAPLVNADGSTGVNVIHDYGQGGVFTGGNFVADADGVIDGTATGVEYYQIYNANFALKRRGYFHYVVMPHQYIYDGKLWSSGSAQAYAGARRDRIIVSLYCQATDRRVGNTIMHELGHNFMLLHGGDSDCNRKPNYNSVMNYDYQFVGPDRDCDAEPDIGADYSSGQLPDLDESALDEFKGVCGTDPIDWDVSSSLEAQLTANLNKYPEEVVECGGEIGVLRDHDDWSAIELDIDAHSDGGGKPMPPAAVCSESQ